MDNLVIMMKNYETVYTAWDKDKLIGLICAMDDGNMNAYVHYLLVHPDYHKMKYRQNPRSNDKGALQGLS